MRIIDTAQVLARIQAFNNRTVDELVITTWHKLLEPYDLDDCLAAVDEYFASSKDWIMPVDIIERVHQVRTKRITEFSEEPELRAGDIDVPLKLWTERQHHLLHLIRTGQLTQSSYKAYHAGTIDLPNLPKEITA